MKIKIVPLSKIRPYHQNPRINEDTAKAVAESISRFGFNQPLVLDPQNTIIVGHSRWKAAQILGLTEVPCYYPQNLTPAQIAEYRIADNSTADFSEWDMSKLMIELRTMEDAAASMQVFFPDIDVAAEIDKSLGKGTPVKQASPAQTKTVSYTTGAQDLCPVLCPHCRQSFQVDRKDFAPPQS